MNREPANRAERDDAEVVDLAARRRGPVPMEETPRESRTLILQVSHIRTDAEAHRHIGIDDSLHLRDFHHVISLSFAFAEQAPWVFSREGVALDGDDPLHRHVSGPGDQLDYTWGLWEFSITVADSWARDKNTPRALCVGGSGTFQHTPFSLNEINAELTGEQTIETVLADTVAPVRDLVERSGLYDFVPLLQALDLRRTPGVSAEMREELHRLPYERDDAGRDAFWAKVLSLASLAAPAAADHILESTMAALGWVDDDGSRLSADATRALCAASWETLKELGAAGMEVLSPVDRLDLYRELLRAPRSTD